MPIYSRKTTLDQAARPAPLEHPDLFKPTPTVPALPVLGIDIAKATFRACLLIPGQSTHEADFSNDAPGFAQLTAWLQQHHAPTTRAGLEATGCYSHPLLTYLHNHGHHASLLNPRWVKDYARSEGRRNKTDPADARVIARYLATHAPRAWEPLSPAQSKLRAYNRRREELTRMLIAEKLRLQSAPETARYSQLTITHLQRQIATLERELTAIIKSDLPLHTAYNHLLSIPSVGPATARTVLAEMPPVHSFARVRDLAAWAGLTPALKDSGQKKGQSRMNKQGNPRLRKALYMPALVLYRSKQNNGLVHFGRRLSATGKAPKAILGALMRKLLQVIAGVLKHSQPFNPSLA